MGLTDRFCTKRVILRSLVRENRTQGSARGRSGNWPFYLDVVAELKIKRRLKMEQENNKKETHPVIILASVILGIAFVVAAIYGFKTGWNFGAMIFN